MFVILSWIRYLTFRPGKLILAVRWNMGLESKGKLCCWVTCVFFMRCIVDCMTSPPRVICTKLHTHVLCGFSVFLAIRQSTIHVFFTLIIIDTNNSHFRFTLSKRENINDNNNNRQELT